MFDRPSATTPSPIMPSRSQTQVPSKSQSLWVRGGRATIAWAQRFLYHRLMATKLEGSEHVPAEGGFLVAANHASHLDAGLVKMALGARGEQLRSLAAQDYFFAHPWHRWYFENFTNVLPIERRGGFRTSLKRAVTIVRGGTPLLIFPEGTRSTSGEMASFKPAISSMALNAGCPIVPIYLSGTHAALPKGKLLWPRARKIGAVVGPAIPAALLRRFTAELPRHEAYRLATRAVELAVHALAEGRPLQPEVLLARLEPARAACARAHAEEQAEVQAHVASQNGHAAGGASAHASIA